ncbi:MAG: hypothetical protein AAGF12_42130 [Myxococcota bacterium]
MERAFAYIIPLAMVAATLWPAFRDPPRDSFPLSDYPMFSAGRTDPTLVLSHVLGVDDEGNRTPIPPRVSAGTFEVLQSLVMIRQAVHSGLALTFCAEVAERVRDSSSEELRRVERLEVVTSTFDSVAYFESDGTPTSRVVHARCEVER